MSTANRPTRKSEDVDLIRLNSVGLSLATIAKIVDCHPTTVTQRLKSLGVPPADTRRSFMEDVFRQLDSPVQEWVADQVSPTRTIKDLVGELINEAYKRR